MTDDGRGKVRYTRSGFEFREVSAVEVVAGVDPDQWWQACPECPVPVQGGPAAVAEHRRALHGSEQVL